MKVGIMSDSHGNTMAIDAALRQAGRVDHWLHAGDCISDAEYLQLASDTAVTMVAGNCDWPGTSVPGEALVELGGHRIFLTHGHLYGVRYTIEALQEAAAERGADVAVYGHTHVADITPGAVLVLNPGSVARPRDESQGSFLLLDLVEGHSPKVKLVRLKI